MDPGRLREAVRVETVGEEVMIHHRFVEVGLPRLWVETTPGIRALLNREIGADALVSNDKQVNGVVELLKR